MPADGSAAAVPPTLPHSLEAEQALLGALLFDNEQFNRIGDRLKPHHFYDPVHGKIFSAVTTLIAKGKVADGVTMKEFFQSNGALAEIGGAVYLFTLLESAARITSAVQDYAALVYDLAMRRELIRIGEEIRDLALVPPEDANAEDQIEEAERKLFSLAESGTANKGFSPFAEALATSIEMAAAAYESDTEVSGLPSGLRDLDRKLGGLHRSDLIILAGRPSMGKTALALNLGFNVARARLRHLQGRGAGDKPEGGIVAFFSCEMSSEQLATRLLSDHAEIESSKIRRGDIHKTEYERLIDASRDLQQLPLHIDETGGISIGQLMARARRLERTHGLDLIIVDYLQLVTSSNRRSEGRVQEVSEITQGLKALAKDLKVPVIALSQLSRQVEQREDKRPQLSDLRESGSIEQDADVVMFVYREAYYKEREEPDGDSEKHVIWQREMDALRHKAEVIIGKQRHGPIGKVELHYDGRFTRFSNWAHEQRGDDHE